MSQSPDPVAQLRRLSTAELIEVGEESLKKHLLDQAIHAHQKHGPLTPEKLDAFVRDNECVRYPTRLVFEFGEMGLHQFAQPELDYQKPEENGRILYLRPILRGRPDLLILAVAYMVPVLNYGDIITDEHCLMYGATLLGLMQDEFYERVCAVADFVGSEPQYLASTPG